MSDIKEKVSFQDLIDEFNDLNTITKNTNWRAFSQTRQNILLRQKLDAIKLKFGQIDIQSLHSSDEAGSFFEQIIDKISHAMDYVDQNTMPLHWFELELFRLRFASMYAHLWGYAGELSVTGTAHALANFLLGFETLEVEKLIVDWEHPEFMARRNMILNYLSSAYIFFFSLSMTLNAVHQYDLEKWLSEGFKACEIALKYSKHFWNIPRNISNEKKLQKKHNYSPYYATLAGYNNMISFLLGLQRFFYREDIKIDNYQNVADISSPESFFHSLEDLLKTAEEQIEDFKEHIKKGSFDINDKPLEEPGMMEILIELSATKNVLKGLVALYRLISLDILTEQNIIEEEVIPELYKYVERFKPIMSSPEFMQSQLADGIRGVVDLLLLFSGVLAIKGDKVEFIKKVEKEFDIFFSGLGVRRYPMTNATLNLIKLTYELKKEDYNNIEFHSNLLTELAELAKYEPRNAFSCFLLGNILKVLEKHITVEEFNFIINGKFEELLLAFPQSLSSEIEIYLSNLVAALNNNPTTFDMTRLQSLQFFDVFSIFIPDVAKLATKNGFPELVYIPFNLESDYLVKSQEKSDKK